MNLAAQMNLKAFCKSIYKFFNEILVKIANKFLKG